MRIIPTSLRAQFAAGSIILLIALFVLVSFNTTRVLKSVALENLRSTLRQTSETLNLAIVPHTTPAGLVTLDAYLNGLVEGNDHGIIYIAVTNESGQVLVKTHSAPLPLPAPQNAFKSLPADGILHVAQPILLADDQIGSLHYGFSAGFIEQANARILRENLLLLSAGLGAALLLLAAVGLRANRQIRALLAASQSIAAGNLRTRAPAGGPLELAQLAHNFNVMVDALAERAAALEGSQLRYRTLFDQANDAILLLDRDAVVECNAHTLEIFDRLREECVGHALADFSPVQQRDGQNSAELLARVFGAALGGMPQRFEWLFARGDGRQFDADVSLSALHYDGRTLLQAIVRDITQRKLAEAVIRRDREQLERTVRARTADLESKQRQLELVIESLPAIFFMKDRDGRHLMINRQYELGTGFPRERVIGHDDTELFPAPAAAEIIDIDQKVMAGSAAHTFEELVPHADGTLHDYLTTKMPMLDEHGKAQGLIGVATDVTALKRLQRELAAAKEQAERLASVKSEFLANMSHEIRTPLNAILGLARMGMRDSKQTVAEPRFDQILAAARHLLGVINDILDFSKIEAGKFGVEERPFNLRATVESAAEMVVERAQVKHLDFVVEIAPHLPAWVRGDPLRLRQVLVNLLSNAFKFTDHGEVALSVYAGSEGVAFDVRDTGSGMSAEQLARLFQPFEQADGSTTRKYGGTGLGLAISRKLARLMGGDLRAYSLQNAGSTFTLWLPLTAAPEQDVAARRELATPGPRLAGLRVLAAEDVATNRVILEDVLQHEGASVVFAEHGAQVFERLAEHGIEAFDVVLMDVQMPVMDGFEATRQLGMLAPALPVIGVTAHAMTEERERCIAAGMRAHVAKPLEPDEVVTAILNCVPPQAGAVLAHAAPHAPTTPSPLPPRETDAGPSMAGPVVSLAAHASNPVDWLHFERNCSGRRNTMRKLARTFSETNAAVPAALREAADNSDTDGLTRMAHSLKGTSGFLGAHKLQAEATELERLARMPEADLRAQTAATAEELEAVLAELQDSAFALADHLSPGTH
ncbi:MAG: PAS domain-containing protein [Rhodocyclaceae bacterium]|nr:PAS domain-containing protein [Rhodocyclaceae bacterium]